MSAERCRLLTLMPSFLALNSPSVARVNRVEVAPEGVVASAAPTNSASTLTPTTTSNIALFIIYPFSLADLSASYWLWPNDASFSPDEGEESGGPGSIRSPFSRCRLRSARRSTRNTRAIVDSFRAHLSSKLHYLCVDRHDLVIAGHTDAVVAIPHEVGLPYLVEAHRRQLISPVVGAVYAAPPVGCAHLEG